MAPDVLVVPVTIRYRSARRIPPRAKVADGDRLILRATASCPWSWRFRSTADLRSASAQVTATPYASSGKYLFVPVEASSPNTGAKPGYSVGQEDLPEFSSSRIQPLADASVMPGAQSISLAEIVPGMSSLTLCLREHCGASQSLSHLAHLEVMVITVKPPK